MGKKYLLYIHETKFASEPEKSKLVNELLHQHYGTPNKVQAAGDTEVCPGHAVKWDCGREGCKYAN